jgi:hypothetical protein
MRSARRQIRCCHFTVPSDQPHRLGSAQRGGWAWFPRPRFDGSSGRGIARQAPKEGRLTASPDRPRATLGTFMRAPALDSVMQYLLILLVAVTMACGAAASVTISLAPAYVADNGEGY